MQKVTKTFDEFNQIIIAEGVCGNEPIIKGTRIMTKQILDWLDYAGFYKDELINEFGLTNEQIEQALRFENKLK